MSETTALILAVVGGVLLGLIFFGGLKWTVQRGLFSKHPAIWFLASMLCRTTIAMSGFYLAAQTNRSDQNLLACLLGFVAAQLVITWLNPQSAAAAPSMISRG
jgi:F1F0 ATPase subunit 2